MENKTKNTLKKYICRAIGILLFGILIGIGTAILFKETEGIYGITSSIILSFLAVAFSYYQFYLNKFDADKRDKDNKNQIEFRRMYDHRQAETRRYEDQKQIEIRRLNDIKLSVYNRLIDQSNIILEDCSKLLIDMNPKLLNDMNPKLYQDAKDKFSHIAVTIIAKFNRITIDINNYNKLLNTKICMEDIDKIQTEITSNLGSLENREFKSDDERADLYANFHTNINDFASKLSKELL